MGYACCTTTSKTPRSFLTKEERISLLKEYKEDLDKESQGVQEKIEDLEKNWSPSFLFLVSIFSS